MSSNQYDYIIVGAGLSGGILARLLAENLDKRILIVDRRNHISGNIYDFVDSCGIKVQKYGPHVFHTNSDDVYNFISKYCEPVKYRTKCEAVIDGISTPSPFNFKTIDQFYDKEKAQILKNKLRSYYPNMHSVTVVDMLNSSDSDIKSHAQFLFDKDYKLYTAKQWNLSPDEIDPSVLKRVPIELSYDDTYFHDKYEFMPKDGFLEFYNCLVCHKNIEIKTNIEALEHISIDEAEHSVMWDGRLVNLIYTGAIDELFQCKFGVLTYRSLSFKYEHPKIKSYQNVSIVAYPQVEGYTRITEYTKMPYQDFSNITTIAYEYPVEYCPNFYCEDKSSNVSEPYYPVLTENSKKIFNLYKNYAENFKNLTLCGRLADFKYYNMDQVVLRAFDVYESLRKKENVAKVGI